MKSQPSSFIGVVTFQSIIHLLKGSSNAEKKTLEIPINGFQSNDNGSMVQRWSLKARFKAKPFLQKQTKSLNWHENVYKAISAEANKILQLA